MKFAPSVRGILIFLLAFLIGTQAAAWWAPVPEVPEIGDERTLTVFRDESVTISTAPPPLLQEHPFNPERPTLEEFKKLVTCRDKTLALVWEEMKRTEGFWDPINPSYEYTDCGDMFEAYRLDLNGDGVDEIRVHGRRGIRCGATGNCWEWIFRRTRGKKYQLINEYSFHTFKLLKNRTEGFRNIYVTLNDSISASYHYIYRYSRGRYTEAMCWYTDYHTDGSVTNITCAERFKQFEQ